MHDLQIFEKIYKNLNIYNSLFNNNSTKKLSKTQKGKKEVKQIVEQETKEKGKESWGRGNGDIKGEEKGESNIYIYRERKAWEKDMRCVLQPSKPWRSKSPPYPTFENNLFEM